MTPSSIATLQKFSFVVGPYASLKKFILELNNGYPYKLETDSGAFENVWYYDS